MKKGLKQSIFDLIIRQMKSMKQTHLHKVKKSQDNC